jgi:hypothetical protein
MAEREADRAFPERLRDQAVAALESDARGEVSPKFCQRLRRHDSNPDLFTASVLVDLARAQLEVDIARTIEADPSVGSADAIRDALRRRYEGYSREQRGQLGADRHPHASTILGITKWAFENGAAIVAERILEPQHPPRISNRVDLNDDLLAPRTAGARS